MNIGKLNKKIKVYRPDTETDEELNVEKPVEKLIANTWANISPRTGSLIRGREAGTILSETTHIITVRSRGDITNDCYILWIDEFKNVHRFDIDYVLPPAGGRFMSIYAREMTQ